LGERAIILLETPAPCSTLFGVRLGLPVALENEADVNMWVATGFQATTAFLWWEKRFNPGPLLVG